MCPSTKMPLCTTAAALLACIGIQTLAMRAEVDSLDLEAGARQQALFASNLTQGSMFAGRYQLGAKIEPPEGYADMSEVGHGAFGITYKAHDTEKGMDVAIKLFKVDRDSDDLLSKKTAKGLPAIMRLLSAKTECDKSTALINANPDQLEIGKLRFMECLKDGTDEDPAYVVLEYVKGKTLSEWKKPFEYMPPPADMIRIAFMMFEGLNHIEGKFVHRDIKGDNVMVWKDEAGLLQLKFIDYGLAVEEGKKVGVGGSPDYLTPEEFKENDDYVATSSKDVWAVGITIYKTLCEIEGSFKENWRDTWEEAVDETQQEMKFVTMLEDPQSFKDLCSNMGMMLEDENKNNLPLYHFMLEHALVKKDNRLAASTMLTQPIFQKGYNLEEAADVLESQI